MSLPCYLHLTHSPEPLNSARHHVLPKSWGGLDEDSNLVVICPTGHENTHTVLNWFVRYGGPDSVPYELKRKCGYTTWALALRAWDAHVGATPYTMGRP